MRHLFPLLRALLDAGVRFVVVGGVAVVLQGHPRMTVDLDLVVDLEEDNVLRAIRALQQQGLVPRLPVPAEQFAVPEIRRAWVSDRNLMAFSMRDPADPRREVDILATEPVPFGDLWSEATTTLLEGVEVRVASRDHLIQMKTGTGRPQDLADVHALRLLQADDLN